MAKKNPALEKWLESSKKVNQELAEDPEAREAAAAQAAEATDNGHVDPTDEESPGDEGAAEAAAEAESAAEAAAESAEAAADTAESQAKPEEQQSAAERAELARLRRERDASRRQLQEARQQNAELQRQLTARPAETRTETTAAASPVQSSVPSLEDDPKPDQTTHPVEYQEWMTREAIRRAEAAERRATDIERKFSNIETTSNQERMENEFISVMESEKGAYRQEHPEFDAKLDYLKDVLRKEARINGMPEHQITAHLRRQETQFLLAQVNRAQNDGEALMGAYALDRLMDMADARGYRAEAANGGAQTGRPATQNGKTAASPAAKIVDGQKRANAAKSVTTMGGAAAETFDPSAPITAERFLRMTPAQRAAYKKQHPDTLDRLMSDGEETGGVHPLLAGR